MFKNAAMSTVKMPKKPLLSVLRNKLPLQRLWKSLSSSEKKLLKVPKLSFTKNTSGSPSGPALSELSSVPPSISSK